MSCVRFRIGRQIAWVSIGGDIFEIQTAERTWRFEEHPHFGPALVGKDDRILDRQPGPRSAFWRAYEQWRKLREGPAI